MKVGRKVAWLVLVIVGVYYAVPMIAMTRFAFQRIPVIKLSTANLFEKWTIRPLIDTFFETEFRNSAMLSVKLAIATAFLTLV